MTSIPVDAVAQAVVALLSQTAGLSCGSSE